MRPDGALLGRTIRNVRCRLNISDEGLGSSELQESAAFGAHAVDVTAAEPRERLNAQDGIIPALVIFQTACHWSSISSVPEVTPFLGGSGTGRPCVRSPAPISFTSTWVVTHSSPHFRVNLDAVVLAEGPMALSLGDP